MPVPKTSSPIIPGRVFLQDTVYDALHAAIVSGELAPGSTISDHQIVEMYGVTRAPARSALQRLTHDGLVLVQPQVGSRVRAVTRGHTVEAMAVYRRITEAGIRVALDVVQDSDLHVLRERAKQIARRAPGHDAMRAVDDFYDVFLLRSGNRILQRIHTQTAMHLRQAASVSSAVSFEHAAIADAVAATAARDLPGVLEAVRGHLDGVQEVLLASIPESDAVEAVRRTADRSLLRDQTYLAIRDAIADRVLAPGERLRAEDLVEWLGVSKAPIRDALSRLSDEGLVEMVPNRYTRVAEVDEGELAQATVTQLVLFRTAIELSAEHLTPALVTKLDVIAGRVAAAIDADASSTVLSELGEYMDVLCELSGNGLLLHFVRQVGPRVSRALSLPDREAEMQRLNTYFARMHEAVKVGEPMRAGDLLREFATESIEEIRERGRAAVVS